MVLLANFISWNLVFLWAPSWPWPGEQTCLARQTLGPSYWYLNLSLDQLISEMICVHLFGFESGLPTGEPHEVILHILSHAEVVFECFVENE